MDSKKGKNNMNRKEYMKKFLYILLGVMILMFLSILIGLLWSLFFSPIKTDPNEQIIISVIAIAVTVWIGLNIYSIVSKDDIDRLQKDLITTIEDKNEVLTSTIERKNRKLEKDLISTIKISNNRLQTELREISNNQLQKGLREIKDNIRIMDIKLSIMQFISLLNETKTMYIISYYFALNLSGANHKIHKVDYLVEIEYYFIKTTQFYENGNYEKSNELAQKVIDMINTYENETKDLNKNQLISAYNKCRLSDMYFYKNISAQRCHKKHDINELQTSIDLYKELKEYIEEQYIIDKKNNAKYIKNEVFAYIHNTIAYTYQEMYNIDRAKDYNDKAKEQYQFVFYYYKERGRYYRNYGTFLERNGHREEAMKNYQMAIELDKSDYKAYNNLYSLKLKLIENKINDILKNEDKLLFDFDKKVTDEDKDTIEECIVLLKNVIQMNAAFCDCYYNLAKGYMLKYLCCGKDESLLDEAMIVNDFVFVLDKQNSGALFIKRNIYEAWGKIEEANKVNDKIKNTIHRKTDANSKEEKYKQYLGDD